MLGMNNLKQGCLKCFDPDLVNINGLFVEYKLN